jgi:3-oxoacyl-[acyl-carrier protein] reductase
VNNAGITHDGPFPGLTPEAWTSVTRTSLDGFFHVTQPLIMPMVRKRWGRIINITSINGQIGQTGQANYSASKAGLIGLTMSVAREVASRNITVNAVSPGYIETAMTNELSPEMREQMLKFVPLGRVGQDIDVANAVCFLASDEASYITGHVLNVNGGLLMG